jgi:hypothetical protein
MQTPGVKEPPPIPGLAPVRWFAPLKNMAVGALLVLVACAAAESVNIIAGNNFHEAAPGVYRCAQVSGPDLAHYVKKYHIKTVINLRGCCDPSPWYLEEARVCSRLDVSLEDLGLSAGRLPPVDLIRELVRILEESEYPILVHCHRGIDRTGMTCAMAMLLRTDCSLDDALYQLGPRYGHLSFGPTGNIDRFFDLYQEYLEHKGVAHSRQTFRHWALNQYCPGECRCQIEVLEPPGQPAPVGRPFALHIRCHNTSVKPWRFRPNTDAGIHAVFQVFEENGAELYMGRAGLFHAEVRPGESIDLTLSMPPLRKPGKYRLRIDMKDEQHAFFYQLGYGPLFWDVVAE